MKAVKVFGIFLLVLAVAASALTYAKWDEWTLWPELRKPVLAKLKDPDSAKFRNQHVGRRALCGEVNARNGTGGYAGYSKFIAGGERFALQGSSTETWYSKSDDVQRLTTSLSKTASLGQQLNRTPTQEELQIALFDDLWREYCEGIV